MFPDSTAYWLTNTTDQTKISPSLLPSESLAGNAYGYLETFASRVYVMKISNVSEILSCEQSRFCSICEILTLLDELTVWYKA